MNQHRLAEAQLWEAAYALAEVLMDITRDCRGKAQAHWKKNKGWAAAYWKTVGVYAYHTARAVRP